MWEGVDSPFPGAVLSGAMTDRVWEHWMFWPQGFSRGPKWRIKLEFTPIAGRAECVGFEVRSYRRGKEPGVGQVPEIGDVERVVTASLVRSIPLGRLIAETRRKQASGIREFLRETGGKRWGIPGEVEAVDFCDAIEESIEWFDAPASSSRGGRPGKPPSHYALVSQVYADALAIGDSPTKAVAEALTISRSAAAKQVAKARMLGFLGPTTRGRPGGIDPEQQA